MHIELWTEAARADRLLAAAGATTPNCSSWAVYGLPSTLQGVPLFVNGFPRGCATGIGRPHPRGARGESSRVNAATWNGERCARD